MPRTPARRTRAVVVVVAAAAVIATGTLAVATAMRPEGRPAAGEATADAPTATPSAEPDAIDRQIDKRRIFALRSDRAYVEKVAAASDTVSSDWTGLRLTPAEAAEFARQETLPAKLEEMRAILAPLGASGGVWVENPVAEPQVMVVAIVGEVGPDVRERIAEIAGAGGPEQAAHWRVGSFGSAGRTTAGHDMDPSCQHVLTNNVGRDEDRPDDDVQDPRAGVRPTRSIR